MRLHSNSKEQYGLAVAIRHDFGYQGNILFTIYGHLDQVDVVRGQYVKVGEQLGLSGETGKVTGPHLHFEVWKDGQPRDPNKFLLTPSKGES